MYAGHYPGLRGSIRVLFDPPLEAIGNRRWFETLWDSGAWAYGYDPAHADGMDYWTEHNKHGEVIAVKAYLYTGAPYNPEDLKYWEEIHRATLDESLCIRLSPVTMRVLEMEHGFRLCWFESEVHRVLTRFVVVDDALSRASQWAWK